ncbi:MAG TPA: patatin [Cyanobacteria bacterium UBA12227]|nr:patatin [Cyanobacteria bacterium UBA12227]HAX89546.1 patatin [Cyanobacteria bacterium UBA11370]
MSVEQILNKTGQRKLLALDGGGIRGIVTVEVLAKIESLLQQALGRDDTFVLADYFDYIAGTSTGAIIATCVSLGMRVDEIRKFYLDSGAEMFDKTRLLKRFRYRYEDNKLARQLQDVIGAETRLGSDKLKTLLLLILRNATTDSAWPVSNNPKAMFNLRMDAEGNLSRECNLELPLWQLVRASTAAPTFFPPEVVQVGNKEFIFVDGGITPYNNPAFQLFLMATVEPYNLSWETGEDKMLLVSIGTGLTPGGKEDLEVTQMNLLFNAGSIPLALMNGVQLEQDFLCRVFGNCLAGDTLDYEVGDMIGKKGPLAQKLFTYVRYNADLVREGLNKLDLTDINPEDVQQMDSVEHIRELQRIGKAIGEKKVRQEHFAQFI